MGLLQLTRPEFQSRSMRTGEWRLDSLHSQLAHSRLAHFAFLFITRASPRRQDLDATSYLGLALQLGYQPPRLNLPCEIGISWDLVMARVP